MISVTKILRACVSRFSANEGLPLHVDLNPGQDGQGKLNMIQARKGGIFCVENAQQNQFEPTRLQRVSEVIVQVAKEVLHAILQKLRRHLPSHVVPDVLQKHVLAIAINLNSALMKLEYWVNHSTVRVATPPSQHELIPRRNSLLKGLKICFPKGIPTHLGNEHLTHW